VLDRPPLLVFDVESVGLHGEGYAIGVVLIERHEITEECLIWCHPANAEDAEGEEGGHRWAVENVLPKLIAATGSPICETPREVRDEFWALWSGAREKYSAQLMADCTWPVEANFLSDCIADDPVTRYWMGPYPLLDAATLRAAGLASETEDVHEPLTDAKETWESIRDWWASGD
jgi:hypothetical protein